MKNYMKHQLSPTPAWSGVGGRCTTSTKSVYHKYEETIIKNPLSRAVRFSCLWVFVWL
jgi:hypothetical protein